MVLSPFTVSEMASHCSVLLLRSAALLRSATLLGALSVLVACGGSGGGSQRAFDARALLLSVEFPDFAQPGRAVTVPPNDAPLIQPIVFRFSARPDPVRVSDLTLPVRDPTGSPVLGRYVVVDEVVTFYPRLPLRPFDSVDQGGAGLRMGQQYTVRIGPGTWEFVDSIASDLLNRFPDPTDSRNLLVQFQTTTALGRVFQGLEVRPPRVISVSPPDGSVDVSPQLYTDPDAIFAPRRPFLVRLDQPLHPALENLGGCALFDLGHSSGQALSLGVDARLLENEHDGCLVEIQASGILPFGHLVSLEIPQGLQHLSSAETNSGSATSVVSTFTIADSTRLTLRDELNEHFDDNSGENRTILVEDSGGIRAEWNCDDSGLLVAARPFDGTGVLGRFVPARPSDPSQTHTILLDTNQQRFPLFDGSTPDAPANTVVTGGAFDFTDIVIPEGVVVQFLGTRIPKITATGTVFIAGRIEVHGKDGPAEFAYDSSITSLPGGRSGPGGGRGGEGHPINPLTALLVPPPAGGQGFGPGNLVRTGGGGGQCGMIDHADSNGRYGTDSEIDCLETTNKHNNGYKPPGGGGGSMRELGRAPFKDGIGNVLADGFGGYLLRTPGTHGKSFDVLARGTAGIPQFLDADPDNDFFGPLGEFTVPFGGQGGGAGGSALDSYYCGVYCLIDSDRSNDGLCQAEFSVPPTAADTAGDARGGAGGGGGGVLTLEALGSIVLDSTAVLDAHGGVGGGGEAISCGNWSGGGGGGAGGALLLQSGTVIVVRSGAKLDVAGGVGALASSSMAYITQCSDMGRRNIGAGGDGGDGLLQLQVPFGTTAQVEAGADLTEGAWIDPDNRLNPARFSDRSVAVSQWTDLGRSIAYRSHPHFDFSGLDASGRVLTDATGNVLDPVDIRCDYLGQLDPRNPGQYLPGEEPRTDYVPPSATVHLEFQGASAITEGSKEVDPSSLTPWSGHPSIADGLQFLRWRVTFDVVADPTGELEVNSRRPAVQRIRVLAEIRDR